MLIDCHCHLNELKNIKTEIEICKKQNILLMISNSENLDSMKKNLILQKKFKEIKACLGIHPQKINLMNELEIQESIDFIKENSTKCVGIGEIGLDFKEIEKEKQIIQEKFFKKQCLLAKENHLPVSVHSRIARQRVIDISLELDLKNVLLHRFSGNENQIQQIIENAFFVSFGPNIINQDFLNNQIKAIPLECILSETDCPVPFNNQASSPCLIKKVVERISEIKQIDFEKVEMQLEKNARKLFPKAFEI